MNDSVLTKSAADPALTWAEMQRREAEWLSGLKVGDTVAIPSRWGAPSLSKVIKVTATQIVTLSRRYKRATGRSIGSSTFGGHYLKEPTAEIMDEIETERLLRTIEAVKWDGMPLDTLRAIVALIPQAKP